MDLQETREQVLALLSAVKATLPEMYLGMVPELIEMNEWKIAVEMLCEHFGDQYDRFVPNVVYDKLIAVARLLRVDSAYWGSLRVSEESGECDRQGGNGK
jgi:hypothetical protein